MLKNKTKIIAIVAIILLVISTFSFATDTPVTTSDTNTVSTVPGENARDDEGNTSANEQEEPDIHNGDLYVFDDNVDMNQLVDGNVFLFGNNINVTGKVNGSLYAFGNNITFGEESYIVQAIYAFGNKIELNGSANDMYVFGSEVNMSYNAFAIRDLRVGADTFNFKGGAGRDVFVDANNFNFSTEAENSAIVYGNLTYSSSKELSLSQEFVQGEVKRNEQIVTTEPVVNVILDKAVSLCSTLIYALVVFLLCIWLAPKFLEKASSYINLKLGATSFGIGILAFIATFIGSIILLFTLVGIPIAFAAVALLVLLISIATVITSICIAYKLKEKFAFSKKWQTYLTLAGIVIAIWLLGLIPYAGIVIKFIVKLFGIGVVVQYLFTKNKKEESK